MTQLMTSLTNPVEKIKSNSIFLFLCTFKCLISCQQTSKLVPNLLNCSSRRGNLIIFMMRKTTYFSKERDSLLEIVKKSTASTDSRGEDDDSRLRFYQFFLEQPSAMSCKISKVEIIPKMASQRRYAVYCITVRTDVVQYQIKKRYTQFEKLYQRCLKHEKMNIAFPPRTIFQRGWCEQVTSFRMVQLNKFLEQISKFDANQAFKIQLYDFLHLYDQYQKQKVEGKDTEIQIVTDQFLLAQLVKLNDNPSNILDGFDKIKHSIADRKKRLGFQVARHLFMGFDEYSGLLSITLSSENHLVVMGGLELINWLISPQAHRDYEIFRRMLLKCLPNELVIEQYENLCSSSQLNAQYFKLIKQYLSAKQDADIQIIAKFYDFGQKMEEQYERWVKFIALDSKG